MKRLLPALFLVSCNTHDPSTLVGKDGTSITLGKTVNVASQMYTNVGFDKYGRPRMTLRDNSEAVPIKALDVAETTAGGLIYAGVEKAKDAADAAVAIGAQKQATKQAAINAALESEKIKAGVETTRILTPP